MSRQTAEKQQNSETLVLVRIAAVLPRITGEHGIKCTRTTVFKQLTMYRSINSSILTKMLPVKMETTKLHSCIL